MPSSSADRYSDGPSHPALIVDAEGKLELLLAQHIFSAFMWAIAKHGKSSNRIDLMLKDQTTIRYQDAFRSDDPKTLLSLRLENKVLTGMANAIQQTGLGSLQDAYMCLIPPLSSTKQLPIESVVDFVRRQVRDYEIRGQWEKAVPMYTTLFQICKTLGTEDRDFRKATAMLMDVFRSVCTTLKLREKEQRSDGVETLKQLRGELLQEMNLKLESDVQEPTAEPSKYSLEYLIYNFAKLYSVQRRPDRDLWIDVMPDAVFDDRSGDVHKIFQHPTVFSTILSISDWNVKKEIGAENSKARDILGWSLLHYAAAVRADVKVIQALLDIGVDPNASDLAEWTPLHYAVETVEQDKLEPIIWALLRGGADIEIRGRDGMGLLHRATKKGHTQVIEQLLQAGANIDTQDNSRKTPLHWAAYKGSGVTVKLLLDKGASIAARDDYGRTALHLAATIGAVDELLGRGIDVNAKDRDGRTALHQAASLGDEEVVRLLVELGADRDAIDNDGWTALDRAAFGGY